MLAPEPKWWGEFIRRLRSEPLVGLADDLGVDAEQALAMLIEAGRDMAADKAPWWPELLRRRGELSIRALARLFGTEPRRIRRGLARASMRVGGRELDEGEGVSRLAAYVDMLGKERDRAIARAAGVIPEAVQGERTRLQIAAYRQRARVRLSRDDEEWIRGPRKLRRERFRPEPETLQVVRRPTRLGEPGFEREVPVVASRTPLTRPDRPLPPAEAPVRRPPAVSPGDFYAESRRRDSGWSEREHELDRLLQPTRQNRDGRMRIVRAETARPAVEESAPLGVIRRREVRPESSAPRTVLPTAPPPVISRPTLRSEPVRPEPVRAEVVRPEPIRAEVVRPEPARVPSTPAPLASEPAEAARAPKRRVVAPPAPAAVEEPRRATAPAVRRVAASAPAAAVAVLAAPQVVVRTAPNIEWLVYVPGRDEPLRVSAPDIASAAGIAATMVPANLLARASIWRADAEAPAPEFL